MDQYHGKLLSGDEDQLVALKTEDKPSVFIWELQEATQRAEEFFFKLLFA